MSKSQTGHMLPKPRRLVMGDFNSHSTLWGYSQTNNDGEEVEFWRLNQNLTLLHDAKHKPSFLSARWRRGYNPYLAFVSSRHLNNFDKLVLDPIPRSQHRPIAIKIKPILRPAESKPVLRFNFRKANWLKVRPYTKNTNRHTKTIHSLKILSNSGIHCSTL